MPEIGWKSFGNRWPHFEVIENLSAPSVIFRSHCEILGNLGSRWKSSAIFRSLRQSSEAIGKFLEIQVLWRRKISHIYLKKSWQG